MKRQTVDTCVVGLGPAGLGTAIALASVQGGKGILCIDAGPHPTDRFCTVLKARSCRRVVPCHIIGGVGGAALLSGGKVSDYPAGRALGKFLPGGESEAQVELASALSAMREYVPMLEPSVDESAIAEEARRYKDMGFSYRYYRSYRYSVKDFASGVEEMVRQLQAKGVEVRTEARAVQLHRVSGGIVLVVSHNGFTEEILTKRLVLAVGRLGGSLLRDLARDFDLALESRPYDVGVRLEFPSHLWPGLGVVHKDLKLHFGAARTFCVCSEGSLAPYRLEVETEDGRSELFLLEGYSDPTHVTGMSNLGINIRISEGQESAEGLLRHLLGREGGGTPLPVGQDLQSFLYESGEGSQRFLDRRGRSTINFWKAGHVLNLYPAKCRKPIQDAVRVLAERIFKPDDYVNIGVFGPEVDLFWPRLSLGEGFRLGHVPGVFVPGDAAGYFRGVLQAFCAGQVCGRRIPEASV